MTERRVHVIRVEPDRIGGVDYFVAKCSCSWESLPFVSEFDAATVRCGVLTAEMEGDLRQQMRRRRLSAA